MTAGGLIREVENLASRKLVTVVVPCVNEEGYIGRFLKTVSEQEVDFSYEVLVALGPSQDKTEEVISQFSHGDLEIRVIENSAGFVSPGLNAAIRQANGQIIVRMDVHSEYASDYLSKCVKWLQKTDADNVGGAARAKAKTFTQEVIAEAYNSVYSVGGAKFHDIEFEGWVDTVPYGCWKRESFERFGLFDEQLVRNQDDEHNLRICKQGGKIWLSREIISWYYPRKTLLALWKQYFQYGYWKVVILKKHKLPASWRHLVPAVFVAVVVILGIASLLTVVAAAGFLIVIGTYIVFLIAGSFAIVFRKRAVRFLLMLPVVLAVFHLSYGIGFLAALFDALFGRLGLRAGAKSLSR